MKKANTAVDDSDGNERIKERLLYGIAQSEELRVRVDVLST